MGRLIDEDERYQQELKAQAAHNAGLSNTLDFNNLHFEADNSASINGNPRNGDAGIGNSQNARPNDFKVAKTCSENGHLNIPSPPNESSHYSHSGDGTSEGDNDEDPADDTGDGNNGETDAEDNEGDEERYDEESDEADEEEVEEKLYVGQSYYEEESDDEFPTHKLTGMVEGW